MQYSYIIWLDGVGGYRRGKVLPKVVPVTKPSHKMTAVDRAEAGRKAKLSQVNRLLRNR